MTASRSIAAIFFAFGFACFFGMGLFHCSNDDGSQSAPPDASDQEASLRPAPADDGATPASCRDTCAQDHPNGVALDLAITQCWQASCAGPCIAEDAGVIARPDAGDAGDAGLDAGVSPACQKPVVTDTAACDVCTKASCCQAWDACFGDAECTALNACVAACAP
jgi:hypothetical protein